MPKMTKVYGPERTNLLYAIAGKLLAERVISVAELADHFGYSQPEIRDAVRAIGLADIGDNVEYLGPLVAIDFDELEEDDMVVVGESQLDITPPRLTTKQTAAISAGLKVLEQIPGFEYRQEVGELLEVLHQGVAGITADTIQVSPNRIDSDLLLVRDAIRSGLAIVCDYRNVRGQLTTDRVIEPLRLESRDDVWYLRGFCVSKAHEVRVFRLDSMDRVRVTGNAIDPVHSALPLSDQLYEPGSNAIEVALEVDPEGYSVLTDYHAAFSGMPKNTVRATIKVTSLDILGPLAAQYGGAVRVIAPAAARVAVHEFASAALGLENHREDVD